MTIFVLQMYTKNMIIRQVPPQTCFPEILIQIPVDILHRIFLYCSIFYGRIEIIQHCIQLYSSASDCLEAEQCMVDTSQLAGSYEYQWILFFCNVINRQVILSKGNHCPPAPSTTPHRSVGQKFLCGVLSFRKSIGRLSIRAAR